MTRTTIRLQTFHVGCSLVEIACRGIFGDSCRRRLGLHGETHGVICAAAVLHHLRETEEWHGVFTKFHRSLKPGGSFWISDLIEHSDARVQLLMWERYGSYLSQLKDEAYRNHVFEYIAKEDSPRPLMFQLDLLRSVGFKAVDILHKHSCFAAFGGIKAV